MSPARYHFLTRPTYLPSRPRRHHKDMPRPTLLVAETEPTQALSVRKLVLETGKFNVLTAHSTREAIDLFSPFPNVSASVLVGGDTIDCDAIAQHIKRSDSKIAVIFLQGRIGI